MARIAPTTVPAPQALTVNLNPDPELTSRTTTLISAAAGQTVTTAADSVAASHVLAQLQQMRRWVSGIYRDAKAPLGTAKKTLDAQEKALLGPLREAEQQLMAAIVAFQAQEPAARMQAAAVALDLPKGAPLPAMMFGRPVVDGALSDDRTRDGELGVIVGLRFKRPANGMTAADSHGFVRAVG